MRDKLAALLRKKHPYATDEWIEDAVNVRMPAPKPTTKRPSGVVLTPRPAPEPVAEPEAPKKSMWDAFRPKTEAPKFEDHKDDLTQISGVGPKLQDKLNEAGVHTFEDLVEMSDDELADLDEKLNFKGRIERDDWIGQAKDLMDS